MEIKLRVNYGNIEKDKEVIDRLVSENLDGKLDSYLQKFDKEDVEMLITLTLEENAAHRFNASLRINVDGKDYHFSREDYKNLDDLINHLFKHFKESISA